MAYVKITLFPPLFNSVKPSKRKIAQVIEIKIAGDAIKVKLERKSVSIGPKKLFIK